MIRSSSVRRLVVISALAALLVSACDAPSELTIQVHNKTDCAIEVTIPTIVSMTQAPPKEFPGVNVTIAPGKMAEVHIMLQLGSYAEVVRAYVDGRLIFCERYIFGTWRMEKSTYSVEIVEDHIAPECDDKVTQD